MCLDHGVTITDDLAEKLTPPKPKAKDPSPIMSKEGRVEHLRKLAALLHEQGSFHLATKKYTQVCLSWHNVSTHYSLSENCFSHYRLVTKLWR